MRAVAIFGTKATARDLREFQLSGVEIVTSADLAADCPCDAALLFGGDGSMHRQLPAAVASQVPVLSVPKGSGNDFARALGLGMPGAALSAWQRFCAGANNVRSIDVGEIAFLNAAAGNRKPETGNSLYCCVAGVGLDSEVNRRANLLPGWLRGHGGYVLSVPGALAAFQPPEISVELFESDGPSRIKETAMLVAFANSTSYGHGMRMAPRAQLDDGKLDVVFVRHASKLRLLRLFPTVFAGRHLKYPEIVYSQCSGLKIESERPLDIYADGEFIGRTPAEVRVRPRALRVIVP
jgi:diacylglycerol kinase (ATP)